MPPLVKKALKWSLVPMSALVTLVKKPLILCFHPNVGFAYFGQSADLVATFEQF